MKIITLCLLSMVCVPLFACEQAATPTINSTQQIKLTDTMQIKITIGKATFTATLNNTATATAFKALLPLTITMQELNGNEKFFYFPSTLPTHAAAGGDIEPGDLMLYGNNCLVIFYEGLHTTYRYTRLGRIHQVSGLAAALGNGTATLRFERL